MIRPPARLCLVVCFLVAAMPTTTTTEALSSPVVNSKPHILSVGLSAVDFVATVDHVPKPDEKMRSTSLLIEGGGNAANTASAIGRLNDFADVTLVTAVGEDVNGQIILDGITSNQVVVVADRYAGSSPFSYILCADVNGESTRTIIHQPQAGDMSINFVEHIPLDSYTAAHFDLRYPKAAMVLGQRLVAANIPYSVDVERPREGLLELLATAAVVIVSSDYCDSVLSSSSSNDKDQPKLSVAQRLRKVITAQAPKAKIAIQTLGGKGCCLIRLEDSPVEEDGVVVLSNSQNDDPNAPTVTQKEGGVLYCPAFAGCQVVDTTGAGDAFQGGFITALWAAAVHAAASSCSSSPLQVPTDTRILAHALRFASRVAAKKVEQAGARRGLPYSATDAFLQQEMNALLQQASAVAAKQQQPVGAVVGASQES